MATNLAPTFTYAGGMYVSCLVNTQVGSCAIRMDRNIWRSNTIRACSSSVLSRVVVGEIHGTIGCFFIYLFPCYDIRQLWCLYVLR
jgi:hypothetical protein